MRRILIFLTLLVVLTASHAADFSDCARFFNNDDPSEGNLKGYRTKKSGPFVPERLRYIPFHLKIDGSVVLHEGATMEEEINRAGRVGRQIIRYQSPDIESLEMLDVANFGTETKPVKVIIERDSQGHITAITENIDLITDEEEDDEIERIRNWAGGDADLSFAYKGTRTTFGIIRGSCLPLESKELIVRYKDGKKQDTEIVVFNTKLCQKIREFIVYNQEAKSCFDRDFNTRFAELLDENARELLFPEDKEKEFLSNDKVNELINKDNISTAPKLSLRLQALTGYMAGTQLSELKQRKLGLTPIISGHMILQNCYYQGLLFFVKNSRYWLKEEKSSSD